MALVAPVWGSAITAELAGKGFIGLNMAIFGLAVGTGSAQALIGASFETEDAGTTPGAGVGSGAGLSGIVGSLVASQIIDQIKDAFKGQGERSFDMASAVGNALEKQLALATLTSIHDSVFAGAAVLKPGSLKVDGSQWGKSIYQAGKSLAYSGDNWPLFAQAIGEACADALENATAVLTITGVPASTPTAPGKGAGKGIIA